MKPMPAALMLAIQACCFAAHAAPADAELGRTLYQSRCAACHSLDHHGVGPAHRGLWGRLSGQAPGFASSDALRNAHQAWNEDSLDRWLADPEKFAPGQRMGVSVPDAQDRANLIAYLKKATAR